MQDPWFSDYYNNKPAKDRPVKHWFSYRFNKYMEPIAMKSCDGLISVSQEYIDNLRIRYPNLKNRPSSVITFGVSEIDAKIAAQQPMCNSAITIIEKEKFNLLYIGVCGSFMHKTIERLLLAVQMGLNSDRYLFEKLKISFIGTSYAPKELAKKFVLPIATQLGIANSIYEQTDRISYYDALQLMNLADALFIPGTDESGYTASKLYPYIMSKRPILAIFHQNSNAIKILEECTGIKSFLLNESKDFQVQKIYELLKRWLLSKPTKPKLNYNAFRHYTAYEMAKKQVDFFNEVLFSKQ